MSNVNANVNVVINTQQAITQLRLLSAEINNFNKQSFATNSAAAKQQRALSQALIDGVKTSGQFATSIVPVSSAVDNFSTSLERNRLSLGQYTRYAGSQLPGMRRIFTREFDMINRVAVDRVKRINTQFISLGQAANGTQRALSMMPNSLDQFAAKSAIALQRQQVFNKLLRDGSTQLLNWGKNTQWAGRQLMVGFTIPLGILGAQAAKVFKELEAETINFKKVYGDMFTTDAEVEKNLEAIKELSIEMTKYGQTAKQTMQLANTAAQSGARGAELMAATTQATRLAILGQMEQSQAIETTISLQTAFAMSNEDLADSINFLNSVENQTILSLQDVSEAIPRVASVIKGFGGDVQDLSVLLVAMKEGGVSAAEGANALKNSMARIISPTKNALEVSAKYGIALQEIVSRNDGKVVPLFQELARVLESLGGQQRQEVLSAVFGKFQYARIGTLLSNIAKEGSQAAKAIELTGVATRDLAATAERELGAVEDSISTKFTAALEKAKIALAPVGEQFLKALTPILDVVSKILKKFDDLPGGIKTAIVAATAIIGGLAPIVLMVTGLVANGIANIGKFILFLRKQVAILRGNGEQFKFYARAELDAAAAASSLEGKTTSLTSAMLLQKPAIQSLVTLYGRLAESARMAAAVMPATMGMPMAGRAAGPYGLKFITPQKRNKGGAIFAQNGTTVPGVGNTDTVPAMLTPGEFVINKKSTQQNLPLIKAINSGKIKEGGEVDSSRNFYGRFNAKTVKMFSDWISAQPSVTSSIKKNVLQDPSLASVFRGGFRKSRGAETLQRATWMDNVPAVGETLSLGALASFSPKETSVRQHLANSSIQQNAEFAASRLSVLQRQQKEDSLKLKRLRDPNAHPNTTMWANNHVSVLDRSKVGKEAAIDDLVWAIGNRKSQIKSYKKDIRNYREKTPVIIEIDTPRGTIRANVDDIVDLQNQMYMGKKTFESERILHNPMIKVLGMSDEGGRIKRIKGKLISSEYPGFNLGGMVGGKIVSSSQKLERIKKANPTMSYVKEQSLEDVLKMGFNDTRTSSPSSFLNAMFARWEKTPSRPSLKENTRIARKTGKLRYPMTPQDEYLADMIRTMDKFDDYAPDIFKPLTVGNNTVYDGHTRIQAKIVKGLIEGSGKKVSAMSNDELIQAIEAVKRNSLAGKIDDSSIISIAQQQKVLTQQASRRDLEGMSPRTHPSKRRHMQSMYNSEGRILLPGVHDRELAELVSAGKTAKFRGYGKTDEEILKALGFVRLGKMEDSGYFYNPTHDYGSRKGYVANTSSRIIRNLVEEKKILPIQRNLGGTIPGSGNTDKVPAMLTPGEFVINKKSTEKNLPLIQAINSGEVPGFNRGGMIPGYSLGGRIAQQIASKQSSARVAEEQATKLYTAGNFEKGFSPTPVKNFSNTENLHGPGVYTTRDEGVAQSYLRRGSEGAKSQERKLYEVSMNQSDSKKFLNMDKSADDIPNFYKIESKIEDGAKKLGLSWDDIAPRLDQKSGNLGEWRASLVENATDKLIKLRQAKTREAIMDAEYDASMLFVDSVKKSDYIGLTHMGGLRQGQGEVLHPVYIWYTQPKSMKNVETGQSVKMLKANKGAMIPERVPGYSLGGLVAKKVSDLRSYLSARHGAQTKRNWVDPLNSSEMRSGAIYGPGIYQSNMAGRAREYSGLADLRLAVNRDGFVYRNPRDPASLFKVLRGKGYISLDDVRARGLGTDVASYKQLRAEGYKGVTIPQGNGEVWTVDFSSKMKLASSKTPFGLKQATTDWKQLRSVKQSEKRYQKVNAPKKNADDDLTLNKGGFISANKGKIVPGSGNTDTVPAMLTPGEFVINKKATQENLPLIQAINSGSVRGYEFGGKVSPQSKWEFAHLQDPKKLTPQQSATIRAAYPTTNFPSGNLTGYGNFAANLPPEANPRGTGATRMPANQIAAIFKDPKLTKKVMKPMIAAIAKSMNISVEKALSDDKVMKSVARVATRWGNAIEKAGGTKGITGSEMNKAIASVRITDKTIQTAIKEMKKVSSVNEIRNDKRPQRKGLSATVRESIGGSKIPYKGMGMTKGNDIIPKPAQKTAPQKTQTFYRKASSTQASAKEIRKNNPRLTSAQALNLARLRERNSQKAGIASVRALGPGGAGGGRPPTFLGMPAMGDPDGPGLKPSQSRMAKMSSGIGKFGMGAGMGLSMASMMPMMGADDQGKWMGMDASTAMMGMMGGGMLLSIAPMLGSMAAPILGAAAGFGAIALTAKILNDNMIKTAENAADFGANIGATSNALNTISSLFGEKTPVQRSTQMQLQFSSEEQEQSFGQFQNYLGSELGQKFLKDFEKLTGADRFKKLSDYLRNAIASGVMDEKNARLFAKTVSVALNDSVLGSSVVSDLKKNVQESGAKGLLDLAEFRKMSVENNKNILPGTSEMVGASIQIIQDYANALALANEQFALGEITYEEFSSIATEAKNAQESYSKSLKDSLIISYDSGFEEVSSRGAAAFNAEMKKILTEEQFEAMKKATESGGLSSIWGNIGTEIGKISADSFEGYAKSEIGAAIVSGMSADQAIAIMQEIRENPESDLAKIFAERAGEGNALAVAAFSETSDVMAETLGLTGDLNSKFKELGISFLDAGGNLGEFQTFITNLPERLRASVINSLAAMSPEARQQAVTGGTAISGAYGEKSGIIMSSGVYANAQKAMEGRGPKRGSSEKSIKEFKSVQDTLLGLEKDFGEEKAFDLTIAINSLQNGKEIDTKKWLADSSLISRQVKEIENNFPPEISSRINIDFTSAAQIDMWSKSSQVFRENAISLSQLNSNIDINAVLRFLTLDADGEKLTPQQVTANTVALNKAWKDLESSNDIDIRRTAMITVVSSFQDASGRLLDPSQVASGMKDLEKEFGGNIYRLSPDVLYMSIKAMMDASSLRDQAARIREAANKLPPEDSSTKGALLGKATSLEMTANQLEGSSKGGIEVGLANLPKGSGPSGGGSSGGQESPLKGFLRGILDQVKMWLDASAKMKDLNKAKGSFANQILKGEGLFDKLNSVKGIDPIRLQEIMGMGPEGTKDFIKKYVKGGKLTKKGKNILDASTASGAKQTMGEAIISSRTMGMQVRAANVAKRAGASKEVVESIAGDPKKAAEFVRIEKDVLNNVEGAEKAKRRFIKRQQDAIDKAKKLENALKTTAQIISEEWQKYSEKQSAFFDKAFADIQRNADIEFEIEYGQSVSDMEYRIKLNEDLIDGHYETIKAIEAEIRAIETKNGKASNYSDWGLEQLQKEIDSNNELIKSYERQNEMAQRRIETLQRQDELRMRESEAISYELDLMSDAEDKIREAYDKRIEALDKVEKINQRIIEQQTQQLNLSKALSEGDIYAATQAAQEMRNSSASFAREQTRSGLEKGMENEIKGLVTPQGLTRDQAEQRIKDLKDQSYQTSLLIRTIEDEIYNRQINEILPLKDKEYNMNLALKTVQDAIAAKQLEIRDVERSKIEPIQQQNDKLKEQLDDYLLKIEGQQRKVTNEAGQTRDEFEKINNWMQADLAWQEMMTEETDRAEKKANALAAQWKNVGEQIRAANDALEKNYRDIALIKTSKTYTEEDRAAARAKAKADRDAAVAGALASIDRVTSISSPTGTESKSTGIPSNRARSIMMPGGNMLTGSAFDQNIIYLDKNGNFRWTATQKLVPTMPEGDMTKYYKGGSVLGEGTRDSVAARLTPGEFVVRKSMVDKYGIPMLSALNQGSFSMPKYQTSASTAGNVKVKTESNTNVVSPMYNNYSVNVSVSNANASADDVANKVMFKMRQLQNQNIRSNRGQ